MDGYADNRDRSHDSELLIQEGLMAAVVTIVIIPVIVKGLSKMVPWEKYGCEVVGTAEDGLEGLELIRQLRPHIIISDIYMPQMDGLAMATAMKLHKDDKTEKYKKETSADRKRNGSAEVFLYTRN